MKNIFLLSHTNFKVSNNKKKFNILKSRAVSVNFLRQKWPCELWNECVGVKLVLVLGCHLR